ncbi:MAG: hypothetical protein KF819_18830 [Labilithrix sp.]|nr:hypothetical protein [Labilithrix sp.]
MRVDVEGGGSEIASAAGAAAGARLVAIWGTKGAPGQAQARFFDGTTWRGQVDLGAFTDRIPLQIVSDGVHRAFAQWGGPDDGRRAIADLVEESVAPPTSFSAQSVTDGIRPSDLIGTAEGGAISAFREGGRAKSASWDADAGTWEPGSLDVVSTAGVELARNASGHVVAMTKTTPGPNQAPSLLITLFDGTSWSTPATMPFPPPPSPPMRNFRIALAPDDTALLVWVAPPVMYAAKVTPTAAPGAQFGTPVAIATAPAGRFLVAQDLVMDSAGRATLAWIETAPSEGTAVVTRYLNGAFSPSQTLGDASAVRVDLDPSSNVVALTSSRRNALSLHRTTAASSTWTSVDTGITASNDRLHFREQTAVLFPSGGGVSLIFSKPGGGGVYHAHCD